MERREELRGGGLWITGALNRANRRVPLTNLFSLWWPGAGSAPSTFRFPVRARTSLTGNPAQRRVRFFSHRKLGAR